MIGAIYARASTNMQGETIEHQISLIKEYSSRMDEDIKILDRHIYADHDESAYNRPLMEREAMSRMMNDINSGLIDIVFFKGVSRFARDSGDAIQAAQRLKRRGVRVISIEENYDSDEQDPTFFQLYAVFAESESRKTSLRVMLGNREKAKRGLFVGSSTPLGYIRVKDYPDIGKREQLISEGRHEQSLYPCPKYANVIKYIFELYTDFRYGRYRIINELNNKGYRLRSGKRFNTSDISKMISNPVYQGDIVYGRKYYDTVEDEDGKVKTVTKYRDKEEWVICKNAHPPIVSRDTFSKALRIKRERGEEMTRNKFNNAKHPLTGLLRCGKCGASMNCQVRRMKLVDGTEKIYRYYVCSTYQRSGRKSCSQKNINADDLEKYVYENVKNKVLENIDEDDLGGYTIHNQTNRIKGDIDNINKEIKKIESNVMKLLDNSDLYDPETFRSINLKYKNDIQNLKDKRSSLEGQLEFAGDEITKEEINQMFKDFINMDLSEQKEARKLFRDWINSIIIDDDTVYIDQKFFIKEGSEH